MAHPGWVGGGVTAEPWWLHAVFYRIDPARFQASTSATTGDLPGIALRLDYLQGLGIDALVLSPTGLNSATASGSSLDPYNPDALETLVREASRHNLRVVVSLTPALTTAVPSTLLRIVNGWLNAGVAGVAVPDGPAAGSAGRGAFPGLITPLAALVRSTPGDRVLLTGPDLVPYAAASTPVGASLLPQRRRQTSSRLGDRATGLLATAADLPFTPSDAASLRPALLSSAVHASNPSAYPLLELGSPFTAPPGATLDTSPQRAANLVVSAAVLLASPGAALFNFGAEIGLDTDRLESETAHSQTTASPALPHLPLMQWTPANVQQAPIERPALALPAPGQPLPFGAYRPFVRPPPRAVTGSVPSGPPVVLDRDLPPPLPDPNTLPGFTIGRLPYDPPVSAVTLNVATEERDPRSTLNAFRALLALRRGNPALRTGTQQPLTPAFADGDEQHARDVLVFLRRPPAGTRTVGAVVLAANLGSTPVQLSLAAALASAGLPAGSLRALFNSGPQLLTGQTAAALQLPAHTVFLGEIGPRARTR